MCHLFLREHVEDLEPVAEEFLDILAADSKCYPRQDKVHERVNLKELGRLKCVKHHSQWHGAHKVAILLADGLHLVQRGNVTWDRLHTTKRLIQANVAKPRASEQHTNKPWEQPALARCDVPPCTCTPSSAQALAL